MRSIYLVLLATLLVIGPTTTGARTDDERRARWNRTDPDLGQAMIEGVATAQFLWLRGSSRKVVRFDRRTGERSVAADGVIDILADGPHLWALTAVNENEAILKDIRGPGAPDRRLYHEGTPLALFPAGTGPGVLTDTTILLPAAEDWSRRRMAARLDIGAHVSPLIGDALFVGYDKGEWGGGLRRIDVSAGTVSIVREISDELCGGRLNPECSPVVGVVADPDHERCVLAGASLAHLSGRYGEILRVCGEDITSVFADPLPVDRGGFALPGQTWPFDSLVPVHDGWIAVGQDRFARSRGGAVATADVPPLRPWAGLHVSDALDGVIFVEAACCWGSERSVQYQVIAVPISG